MIAATHPEPVPPEDLAEAFEREGLPARVYGEGQRVFVGFHGWSGSRHSFEPLRAHVPPDAALVAFDQPGVADAKDPTEWSMESYLAPILRVLRASNLSLVLVGHCGGAVLAKECALRLGSRVERLVLIDPFAYVPWYFRILTLPPLGLLFYLLAFANPVGRWLTDRALEDKRAGDTNLTEGFERVRHVNAYRHLALLCRDPSLDRFRSINLPVDVLYGEKTFEAVRASALMYQALWGDVRTIELPGAGHLPLHEASAALAKALFADPSRMPCLVR